MLRLWPKADYAEDQRFGKSILTLHALDRGFQMGAFLGVDTGLAIGLYQRWSSKRAQALPSTPSSIINSTTSTTGTTSATRLELFKKHLKTPTPWIRSITNAAGIGGMTGFLAWGAILPIYMYGKSQIEWQDRSWRLLHNEGQSELDDFVWPCWLVGLGSSFVNPPTGGVTLVNTLGRTGLGGVVGLFGYLGWRYGINKGKRGEKKLQ